MNTEDAIKAVKGYKARGLVVHPLSRPDDKGNSPGKKPLLPEWQYLTETPPDIGAYLKMGCNPGLVCGNASGVDALDLDSEIFKDELLDGLEVRTLISSHREGREHILFQHENDMFSEKHHFIGIEYFGNNAEGAGSNLVLPPSVHHSGEVYRWLDPDAPLMKMPEKLKKNIRLLFKREDELHEYFKMCRHCFTKGSKKYDKTDSRSKGLWERPDTITVHGMDGRAAVIAIMSELRHKGCPDELLHMACKRFFGKDYKYNETAEALKYIKPIPPKCETLRTQLNVECNGCEWKPTEKKGNENCEKTPKQYEELSTEAIKELGLKERSRKIEINLPEGHFIIEYTKWMSSISDGYFEYQISCALWVLSVVAQNKFVLKLKQEHIKTNIWVFNIGKSTTSRKTTIVNKTRKITEMATEMILPNQDYSIEGYLETLSINPMMNNVRDEAAGLLQKYHQKYNNGIFDLECLVYDCSDIEKKLASKGTKAPQTFTVTNPYVTKLYATTPENLARNLTIDDFTSGYGYRWIFAYPNYTHVRKPLEMEGVEDIKAWAHVLEKIKILYNTFQKINGTIEFKVESGVMKYYDKVCQELETKAEESNNDILNSVVGRSEIHILKIAMLLELGKKELSTTIHEDTIEQATRMVTEFFIPSIMDLITRLQEDIRNNKIEKIKAILRRLGGTASHTKVLRDSHIIAREFVECIETMSESKTIKIVTNKDNKQKMYILQEHNEDLKIRRVRRVRNVSTLTDIDNTSANSANSIPIDACLGLDSVYVSANVANLANQANQNTVNTITESHPSQEQDASQQQKENNVLCDICKEPLNGSHDTTQGLPGQGKIHTACKSLPIKIRLLADLPNFVAIDNRLYPEDRSGYKVGDTALIPAINACSLVMRRAAERIG